MLYLCNAADGKTTATLVVSINNGVFADSNPD